MTTPRIQPCLRKMGDILGYHNEKEVWLRNITERNAVLKLYNNHFCLLWKSEGVSFNKAKEKLERNFKIVDKYIAEESVNSHFEYIYSLEKIASHLTSFVTYDLETHNTDRARPYAFCFQRINKLTGRYNRDLTPHELEKCKKNTIAFDGDSCVGNASDFCLKLKEEERKDNKNTILEYNLQLHAHNGSGFDTWIIFLVIRDLLIYSRTAKAIFN